MNEISNFFGDVIYGYSRAQALEDGVLVDVTNMAKEAGFKISAAVTKAVWEKYIYWDEEDTKNQTYQDEKGRLWDILWMLRIQAKKQRGEIIFFNFKMIPRDGKSQRSKLVELKAAMGAGDNGKPTITIMLPNED